jgi:hypothetical protein
MEKTFKVINRMMKKGVIRNYAIGGAVGAMFYVEPFATFDIDIFFSVKGSESSLMILAPIYEFLSGLGYQAERESVNIEGWPVQFLPVFNELTDEAVEMARKFNYKRRSVRVMSPEHLVAIMLDTGRAKDYARIDLFLKNQVLDLEALNTLLARHRLKSRWLEFAQKFLR